MSQPNPIVRDPVRPLEDAATNSPFTKGVVVAVFFLSGAVGLVFEVLWTRQLALIFGVTTYAVATVLATYMGGLALGSYLIGRWSDRHPNPLRAYAMLEIGIGLYALLVPVLFAALRGPYIFLHGLDLPAPLLVFARVMLAAAVLLPPTTLMGGTFPILTRFWVNAPGNVGLGAGLLYFVNTSGAIFGCLFAGFWALEHLGLRGTGYLATTINFVVGAVAAWLASSAGARRVSADAAPAAETISPAAADRLDRPAPVWIVLVCVGISGFTSLAYEVLWSRALLRYLYNSSYAFTTMLATFLAGIAVGSMLYVTVLRRLPRQTTVLAALQLLVGLGFAGSAVLFSHIPDLSLAVRGGETVGSFAETVRLMFFYSALVLFVPTVFLGATFPLATALCAHSLGGLGYSIGRVYAVNTLGAILGSLASAFLLIPALGMQGCLAALILVNGVSALLLVLAPTAAPARRLTEGVAIVGIVLLGAWALPADLFVRSFVKGEERLAMYREGATDTVGVVEVIQQRFIRYEDMRGTAGTWSFRFNYFFGHLPMLLHEMPRRVLHICFGVGNSLSAVVRHDELERVDNVELSPHVVEAADYFWTNDGVIHDPKVRTIIDDGRNFIMASREQYDVIVMEPPETFTAGVINLYTTDFYRDALAHLAPNGFLMQWIPTGEAPLDQERMLFRAFTDVFPHVTVWKQLNSACMLLFGSTQPLTIDYQRLMARMRQPAIARDLELIGIQDVDHLLSFFVFDEPAVAEFVRGVEPVTDDMTVLDFSIPRSLGSGFGLGSFNSNAVSNGRNPWNETMERERYYFNHRRSVVPLLRNLGGDTPETIAARIAKQSTIVLPNDNIIRENWNRR